MIRVVLADDEALIREGLRLILEAQEDIEVVAEAATGSEAVACVEEVGPDVVLMDIQMPGTTGIEATRAITAAQRSSAAHPVQVLVLTTFDRDDYVYEALRAGASGFLLKSAPPARLVDAVRLVAAGEALLAPTVTRRLIEDHVRRAQPSADAAGFVASLTPREVEVVRLIARGLSNGEIADELVVGASTVKTHVNRILAKLGLRDRVHIVVGAYESGLVSASTNESVDGRT